MRFESTPSAADFEFHEAPTQPLQKRNVARRDDAALVLIVDDDVDMRAIYRTCLEEFGYRTASESSGEAAVSAATRIRPAAILMDASMPGIGGVEATRQIKVDPRTRGCPIIVVTAHPTSLFEDACAAGCNAYFCKPFNVFALDSVLRLLRAPDQRLPPALTSITGKRCGCGAVYSLDAWLALPLCGRMPMRGPTNTMMELRNCSCGSTLALPVEIQ